VSALELDTLVLIVLSLLKQNGLLRKSKMFGRDNVQSDTQQVSFMDVFELKEQTSGGVMT
jgi:hypothetical protein